MGQWREIERAFRSITRVGPNPFQQVLHSNLDGGVM